MKPMTTFVVVCAMLSAFVAAKSMPIVGNGLHREASANYTGDAPVDQVTPTRSRAAPAKRTISALYFVNKVTNGDMFQTEASRLVEQKGDQVAKTFSRRMAAEQRDSMIELKSLLDGDMLNLQMPTTLDNDHREMLSELKLLKGKAFDDAYNKGQLSGQRDVVASFEQYAKNGENADLRQWAIQMLPHLYETLRVTEELNYNALALPVEKSSVSWSGFPVSEPNRATGDIPERRLSGPSEQTSSRPLGASN